VAVATDEPKDIFTSGASVKPEATSSDASKQQSKTESNKTADPEANKKTEAEANKDGPEQKAKRHKYFLICIILVGIMAVAGTLLWIHSLGQEDTDDAYVDGHMTTISSRVTGTVIKVFVDDNQKVALGDPLLKLDPKDYQVKVDQLQAALVQSQKSSGASEKKIGQSNLSAKGQEEKAAGSISSAEAAIDSARAAMVSAIDAERKARAKIIEQKAQLEFARKDFERYKIVWEQRAVTKQQFDRAQENVNVAQAQLDQAEQDLQQSHSQLLQTQADIRNKEAQKLSAQGDLLSAQASEKQGSIDQSNYASQIASVASATAQLKEAQLQLSYTDINAPVPGRVGRKSVEVGQRVEVGQALMSVVQDDVWVTANFKETQLKKMRVGQKVDIKIDALGGKKFIGHVDSFSPASGAKFSVLPPDNATGNFTKVVQRVPVKIVFEPDSVKGFESRISPGLSCVTTVIFDEKTKNNPGYKREEQH